MDDAKSASGTLKMAVLGAEVAVEMARACITICVAPAKVVRWVRD